MNGDFPFLDIVFFAMVAAFLVLRLRSVLGKRTGNERPPPERWNRGPAPAERGKERPADNVVELPTARKPVAEPLPPGPLGEGVAAIRGVDPEFSLDGFLSGARMAFEMIVQAFADGDLKTLRPLLADEVYGPFSAAVEQRRQSGETLVTELMGIRTVEAADARLNGTFAEVTVRFVSEQVNVVKDAEGRIVEGDPSRVIDVTDLWTFRRDTRSNDPNWQLAATRAAEESGA
ncbi:MAG: Tim44/TimA family putative adaptor protein [Magnetospirillum sp.]|nr:Tim44/TimA family putative adaptor protein [Magnetospirillum sp.]